MASTRNIRQSFPTEYLVLVLEIITDNSTTHFSSAHGREERGERREERGERREERGERREERGERRVNTHRILTVLQDPAPRLHPLTQTTASPVCRR
jgi:hypothetical protein